MLLAQYEAQTSGGVPVATRLNDARFKRMVKPGETIEMEVEITNHVSKAWFLTAKVTCGGQIALRFKFACTMAALE